MTKAPLKYLAWWCISSYCVHSLSCQHLYY